MNFEIAVRHASTGTLAKLASPGIDARTSPWRSLNAKMVNQTILVWSSSVHRVEVRMAESSFAYMALH